MNKNLPSPPPPRQFNNPETIQDSLVTTWWVNWVSFFSILAFLWVSVAFSVVSAATVEVSGTIERTPGTYSDDFLFQGTNGRLNTDTQGRDVSTPLKITGSISSENINGTFATGTIHVYGNTTTTNNNGLFLTGDVSDFHGKVIVGNATINTSVSTPANQASNGQRNWLVFDTGGATTGFANAEVELRTKTNSGVLPRTLATSSGSAYYFGALTGSGAVRAEVSNATYRIGALRTNANDVDVFHGYFFHETPTIVKEGAGRWILTGKQGQFNSLSAINVNSGILQIGDVGHVYGEGDLYYTNGTTGNGMRYDGTTPVSVNQILPTAADITIAAGAGLQFSLATAQTAANQITFADATSEISNLSEHPVTLSGTLNAPNGFTKTGSGRIILASNATPIAGTVILKEGTLQTSRNGTFLFDGGALQCNTDINIRMNSKDGILEFNSGSVTVQSLALTETSSTPKLVVTRSGDATYFNNGCNLGSLDGAGPNLFQNFSGTIQIDANAIVSFGSATNFEKTAFHLTTNNTLWSGLHVARPASQRTWRLGDLSGEGLVCTSKNPTYANQGVTFEIGYLGNDSTFSGTFLNNRRDDNGQLNENKIEVKKVGNGTWTLGSTATADSVFNVDSIAEITVSDGALALNRRSGIASAKTLTVSDGKELQILSEGQKITEALTMSDNSKLAFYLDGTELASLLTVDSLTWAETATMEFQTSDDFLDNLHPNMTLDILDSTTALPAELFSAFTSAWENNALLKMYFLPSFSDHGLVLQVNSAAVPEPSTFWLLLLGGMFWIVKRMRKG